MKDWKFWAIVAAIAGLIILVIRAEHARRNQTPVAGEEQELEQPAPDTQEIPTGKRSLI